MTIENGSPYGYGAVWYVARVQRGPTFSVVHAEKIGVVAAQAAFNITQELPITSGEQYVAMLDLHPGEPNLGYMLMYAKEPEGNGFSEYMGTDVDILLQAWHLRYTHLVWVMKIDPWVDKGIHTNEKVASVTTPLFWDCECNSYYIHPKSVHTCNRCGANSDDSPDSRVDEVILAFSRIKNVAFDPKATPVTIWTDSSPSWMTLH